MRLFDTTLRDGLQSPAFKPDLEFKRQIARALNRAPIDFIELAHIRTKLDTDSLDLAKVVAPNKIAVLCADTLGDVQHAIQFLDDCGGKVLHIFSLSNNKRFNLDRMKKAIDTGRDAGLMIRWTGYDLNRLPTAERKHQITEAINAGANTISLPDSLGVETPDSFHLLATEMRLLCADRTSMALHCHNDLGHAVSNSLAGLLAGADEVECTLAGVGTRRGNCSTLKLLAALNEEDTSFEMVPEKWTALESLQEEISKRFPAIRSKGQELLP